MSVIDRLALPPQCNGGNIAVIQNASELNGYDGLQDPQAVNVLFSDAPLQGNPRSSDGRGVARERWGGTGRARRGETEAAHQHVSVGESSGNDHSQDPAISNAYSSFVGSCLDPVLGDTVCLDPPSRVCGS